MGLTYRNTKGSALTILELDNNFSYFTGSHAITGSLTLSGSLMSTGIRTIANGSYTLGSNEYLVLVDKSDSDVSITMPSASLYPGRQIHMMCISGSSAGTPKITVSGSGNDKVQFGNTWEGSQFNQNSESISLICDGISNWYLLPGQI